jgi:mannose-6-phosphate isomerase-like protein (cupin superfamily)
MEFLNLYVVHKDDRGVFYGITDKYAWGEINFIETRASTERGKHFHKSTKELFYILEGRIKVDILNLVTAKCHTFEAVPQMAFIIDPYEVHTFYTLAPSKWINMLSHKLDAIKPDIYRYDGRPDFLSP